MPPKGVTSLVAMYLPATNSPKVTDSGSGFPLTAWSCENPRTAAESLSALSGFVSVRCESGEQPVKTPVNASKRIAKIGIDLRVFMCGVRLCPTIKLRHSRWSRA
jgi:hypothetical protein